MKTQHKRLHSAKANKPNLALLSLIVKLEMQNFIPSTRHKFRKEISHNY